MSTSKTMTNSGLHAERENLLRDKRILMAGMHTLILAKQTPEVLKALLQIEAQIQELDDKVASIDNKKPPESGDPEGS